MIMKKLNLLLTSAAIALSFASCNQEGNEPTPENPVSPTTPEISLQFSVNNSEVSVPDTSYTYSVYIYDAITSKKVTEFSSTIPQITTDLKNGRYKMVVWADVNNNSNYFTPKDATRRSLLGKDKYVADDSQKMVFWNATEFEIDEATSSIKTTLEPQMGQFKLVATDTPDYKVGKIKITYPDGVPVTINADATGTSERWEGLSYEAKFKDKIITFDNIFVIGDEAEVVVDIVVYDDKNEIKSEVKGQKIKVRKGKKTVFEGKIFTVKKESNEDNIKDGFNQDINFGFK